MDKVLNGKVALITGGSRGIGRACAVKLASMGASIAIADFGKPEVAEEAVALCKEQGGEAAWYLCDVSSFAACEEVVAKVTETFGGIDILVNNAGITRDKLLLQMKEEDFDAVLSTNLKGAFNMIRHTYRGFMRKRYGKIINVSSVSGLMGNPGQANYSASKAGIVGLTKTVAKELSSRGINVNAIAPGFIDTSMTADFKDNEAVLKSIPAGRLGKPEEVAELVAFLASPASDYITGEVIRIDGGMAM